MSYDKMNRYWLPNVEINKKVITQELQFYLGPDAHVRPYTRDVSIFQKIKSRWRILTITRVKTAF